MEKFEIHKADINYNITADYTMQVLSESNENYFELMYTLNTPFGYLHKKAQIPKQTVLDLKKSLENFFNSYSNLEYSEDDVELNGFCNGSLLISFKSIGAVFFKEMIHDEIRELIQKLPAGSMHIMSDIDWIPWELLYDGEEYLGNKMFIIRSPSHGRVNEVNTLRYFDIKNKCRNILHVIGPITEQIAEIRDLFSMFYRTPVSINTIENRDLEFLLNKAVDQDILHFSCHGCLEPELHLKICENKSYLENLHTLVIKDGSLKIDQCKLIFANACSSAGNRSSVGEFLDIGVSIYNRGVRIFIGTSGSIPAIFAYRFSTYFYQKLSEGMGIAESFLEAKKRFNNGESIFNLLYVFYSNPCDCLTSEISFLLR